MLPALVLLAPLYLAFLVLMAGNGLLTTLVPLRATLEGMAPEMIGWIGSAYFLGMLGGTWVSPIVIQRAGHIRAFAAYAALAATVTLGFAIIVHPLAWMAFRLIIGFCFAGLFTVVEAWINARATVENRARLLTLSNVANFSGSATGQQILRLDDARSFTLFSGVAGLLMISMLPMALTKSEPPPPPGRGRIDVAGLFRTSPIGCVGMVLIGLVNASFWTLVPAYFERLGFGAVGVSYVMTAMIVGSAIGPYPLGRLADRFDRRLVIVIVSLCVAVVELMLALFAPTGIALIGLIFLLGLGHPNIYPLISAHTNDRAGRDGAVGTASTLLFLYCVGGIAGPAIAAFLMARFGESWLFGWGVLMHVILALFVIQRMTARAAPAEKVVSAATPPAEKPKAMP
jgi:MFS family permease